MKDSASEIRGLEPIIVKTIDPQWAEQRVRLVQAIFRKTLSAWSSDLLSLRRDGQLRPEWADRRPDEGLDADRRVA